STSLPRCDIRLFRAVHVKEWVAAVLACDDSAGVKRSQKSAQHPFVLDCQCTKLCNFDSLLIRLDRLGLVISSQSFGICSTAESSAHDLAAWLLTRHRGRSAKNSNILALLAAESPLWLCGDSARVERSQKSDQHLF